MVLLVDDNDIEGVDDESRVGDGEEVGSSVEFTALGDGEEE